MTCGCIFTCLKGKKRSISNVQLTEPFLISSTPDNYEDEPKSKEERIITTSSLAPTANPESSSLLGLGPECFDGQCVLNMNMNNASKYANVPDEDLDDIQKLEKHCPSGTDAERHRFLKAKGGNYDLALEQLKAYLEWREDYDLDHSHITISPSLELMATKSSDEDWYSCASSDGTLDEIDWTYASDKALTYDDMDVDGHNDNVSDSLPNMLPQLARILTIPGSDDYLRDHDGNRILHLMPAQIDPSLASDDTFALSIAFYLESKLGRNSMEKLSVVLDVRAGRGWANPKAVKLVPFIRKITSILDRNFPERLTMLVLFPLPRAAAVLWKMIKLFLDPNTASKVAVVAGPAATDSPAPYKQMEKLMEREIIDRMEAIRFAAFTS
jgi:hypothetical protein